MALQIGPKLARQLNLMGEKKNKQTFDIFQAQPSVHKSRTLSQSAAEAPAALVELLRAPELGASAVPVVPLCL